MLWIWELPSLYGYRELFICFSSLLSMSRSISHEPAVDNAFVNSQTPYRIRWLPDSTEFSVTHVRNPGQSVFSLRIRSLQISSLFTVQYYSHISITTPRIFWYRMGTVAIDTSAFISYFVRHVETASFCLEISSCKRITQKVLYKARTFYFH